MAAKRQLCILGATGSVGGATLSVVRAHADLYAVRTLVAGGNVDKMLALCREWHPRRAILADAEQAEQLAARLSDDDEITVEGGQAAMLSAVADADCCTVVAAIAGAAGVEVTLAAARAGKRLLLANKEALVVGGALLRQAVADGGGELLPVDSEHCALYELLAGDSEYQKLWLTASGGAVRDVPLTMLDSVSPEIALRHPNWCMGEKITVDSATMMNKVLEILEAAVLFEANAEQIDVVMHPQSICHALVEYPDGALSAALSLPDMRLPVARMLAWPRRLPGVQPPPDWRQLSESTFSAPDIARYPCLPMAKQALAAGGGAPAALSAANEVAVKRFLSGEVRFTDIARINATVMDTVPTSDAATMDAVWRVDAAARRCAEAVRVC